MSLIDGTAHLQSDQFDRLEILIKNALNESQRWREEAGAWRVVVNGMPDGLKAATVASLADTVAQFKRIADFLDRIQISK